MNHLFKRKKSPEPSPQESLSEIPANTVAGPANHQLQSDPGLESGRTRSSQNREVNRLDLTVALDERSGGGSQIAFQNRMDEDQEHPASGAWTSGVMAGASEYRNNPTSECL